MEKFYISNGGNFALSSLHRAKYFLKSQQKGFFIALLLLFCSFSGAYATANVKIKSKDTTVAPVTLTCLNTTVYYQVRLNSLPSYPTSFAWRVVGGVIDSGSTGKIVKITWNHVANYDSIIVKVVAGGVTYDDSDAVAVNAIPNATVISNSSICSGSSISIGSASISGHTYSWSSTPSGFSSAISNPSVSPTATTTYTLLETITIHGCTNTNSVAITVNPLPAAVTGSNQTICAGSGISIGAASVSGDTYSWTSKPSGFTSTASNPTINPTVTTTYYLKETITATACSKTDSVLITVNPLPTASIYGGTTICNGHPATFDIAIPIGLAPWTVVYNNGTSNVTVNNITSVPAHITVNPTTTTTYTLVSISDSEGCSNSASGSTVETVNPAPAPNVASSQSVCQGTTISLGGSSISGYTYSWTSKPSGFTSTSSNPSVTPTSSTTYILSATITATGCSIADSIKITVIPTPVASLYGGGGDTICSGSSGALKVSLTGTDPWRIVFSNGSGNDTIRGITSTPYKFYVSPTTTSTYTLVQMTNANGCVATISGSAVMKVLPAPAANTGSPTTICPGSSTTIGGSAVIGNTYSWISSPSGFTSTSANPSVSPTTTTTYTLTETITSTGCTHSNSVVITVNSRPTCSISGSYTICKGSGQSLFVNLTGQSPWSLVYSNGTTTTSVTGITSSPGSFSVSPTTSSTYTITSVADGYGCTNTGTGSATVGVNPLPNASVASNQVLCAGSSVSIGSSSVSGDTYSWISSPSGFTSTSSNPSVSPTTNTTYTLTETVTATGCTNSNSVAITVNKPSATLTGTGTICNGQSQTLDVALTGRSPWSVTYSDGTNSTTVSSITYTPFPISVSPTTTTTYTVTNVADSNGCHVAGTGTAIVTVNPLPSASTGSAQTICSGSSTTIGAASTAGHTYSWTSAPSGFTSTASNPSVSPTVTTIYSLTETITATGCTNSNSVTITADKPTATLSGTASICLAASTNLSVTLTGISPWSFKYSNGSTTTTLSGVSSSPDLISVSPATATTYTLVSVTDGNSCTNTGTGTAVVTISPAPAANAGSNQSICSGNSATIGAASVSGDTYSWTSTPSGFTSTVSNPSVSPTTTTTYTLTETITATGCTKSNSVTITLNPLPGNNAGSAASICTGNSHTIGAASTAGHTYSWTSSPSGFTSTVSNPSVTPTTTTTYTLVETITATGCTASNTVVITVNPLPGNNAGSAASICSGSSTTIGAASTAGHTYSWTSSPAGFTSTVSNPSVSPTATTTYTLVETITATGCTASNTVVITVNPVPGNNAGSATAICTGSSTTLGAASTAGHTYSWTSNPSGFTSTVSNPSVSPTATTTYTLVETITATTCSATNTVVITVNALPTAAISGTATICNGKSTNLSVALTGGANYSIVYSNGTTTTSVTGITASPEVISVSPAATTTYTVTSVTDGSGCTNTGTGSAVITVNPVPGNNAGSAASVCAGNSTTIGAASTAGHTYSWTSSPSGFTSTVSNPSVSPTTTTTYTLLETITATGCTASNTVVITVNPLPGNNAGSAASICTGSSHTIGAASTAGHTYSWTSNPSGFTSTVSNPSVSPTATTTYTLVETITATGCTASNPVIITVNPLPGNNAGSAASVCTGSSTTIGAASTAGHTYSWTSSPAGFTSTVSNPSVSPTATTTYTLVETITATGCTASNTVVITVNPVPGNNAGSAASICTGSSTTLGAASTAGHTYSWTSSPAGFTSTVSNPSVSPTATTTYTLVETITATTCSATHTVVITVNTLPTATISGTSTICNGKSTNLSVALTGKANWSLVYSNGSTTTSVAGITASPEVISVSPAATTTYTVTSVTDANGCTNSGTGSAVITVNPVPGNNAGSAASVCTGSSTTIGAASTAGHTYSWTSSPAGFTSTVSNPSVSPTATTTYTLVETITATGCSSTNTVVITVNPVPGNDAGTASTICSGGSIAIGKTATAGHTYSWVSNPSGFTSTTPNPTVSPTTTTTYTLTETITATGCTASNSVVITVNALPTATLSGATTICNGSSTNLSVTLTGKANWSITYANATTTNTVSGVASSPKLISVSPTTTSTYTVTSVTDGNGCTNTGSGSTVITVNPVPGNNAGSAQTICNGSSATIGAASTAGHTYSWTSNPSGFTSTVSNPSVSPTITTTYTLVETITATGCTSSNNVVITLHADPTAALSGSGVTICNGTSTNLSVNLTGAADWDVTYYINGANPTAVPNIASSPGLISVSPSTTTTYTLGNVTDGNGCSATGTGSYVVTVNSNPAANAGSNQSLCNGNSVTIGSSSVSGDTYSWTSNPSGFTSTVSNPSVSPTATTTYTLTETITATGCTKSNSVTVTVNPVPGNNAGVAKSVCSGTSATIGAAATAGHTYSWTSNPSGFTSTAANPSVTPTITTTYTLVETITATGCSATNTVVITVNPIPTATISGSATICSGVTTNISIALTGNANWSVTYTNGTTPTTVNGITASPEVIGVTPGTTTTYTVTNVTDGAGCSATGTGSAVITVNPSPGNDAGTAATVCAGTAHTIGATSTAGHTYSWTSNPSGFTSTVANPSVSPTVTTTYTLVETITATGCSATNTVVITVNALPTATISGTATICNGTATNLSVALTGKANWSISYTNGSTSNTVNAIATSPKVISVSPTSTVTYTVYNVTDANGCSNTGSGSAVITVNPLPTAALSGTTSICNGSSTNLGVALTGATPWTVKYSNGATTVTSGSLAGTSSTISVSPAATTTYTLVSVTDNNGCTNTTTSGTAVITVNPVPGNNAGTSQAICSGSSVTLGAASTAGHTYSWVSNPSGFTSTVSNPSVTPTATTTYTLTETITATGCTAANSVVITFHPKPTATITGTASICAGSSTNLSVALTGTANWSITYTNGTTNTTISGIGSSPQAISVSPAATTTYTVTNVTDATTCSNSGTGSAVITVNPLPGNNAGSAATICSGSSHSIGAAATAGHTYGWTSSPSGFTSTSANPSVSPTATTTYTLVETITATTCSATNTVVITVNPLPTATISGTASICNGKSTNLSVALTGGANYSINYTDGTTTSTISGITASPELISVSPTTATTYTVTSVTDGNGCSNTGTGSAVITVNPLPGNNAGSATSICSGSSTTIGAASTAGHTYSWTSSPAGFTSTVSNPSVSPTTTTTYTLAETITATGCSATNSVVITVNPVPGNNAGANSSICTGSSITLGAASTGGHTYSWTSNPAGFTSTSSNPSVSPTATTTYTLKETITATTCSSTNSLTITVNPLPNANVGSSSTICSGSSATIGNTAVGGDTYSWTSSPSGFASTVSKPSVSPTTTTTYTLTEKITATGCTNSNSVVITVNPLPAANAGSNQSICGSGSVTIGASSVSGDTYGWTSSPAGFTSTVSNPTVSPTVTTTYTLTEKVTATTCTNTNTVIVTVNAVPTATISGTTTICNGKSTNLSVALTGGANYSITYTNGTTTSTVSGITSSPEIISVSPSTTTTYTVTSVTDGSGCSSTGTGSAVITVNPVPGNNAGTATSICAGSSTTIGAASTAGHTYSWTSSPAGFTSTVSNPSVSPTVTTTYTLVETITATGCSATNTVVITVHALPTATISGTATICSGSSTNLSVALTGTANWNITYTNGTTTSTVSGITSSPALISVSPTVATTYTIVSVSDANCTNTGSGSAVISIHAKPTATISGTTSICNGGSANLSVALTGAANWSVSYTDGTTSNTVSGVTTSPKSISVSPTTTSTYTVYNVTDGNGCSNTGTGSAIITVNPVPGNNAGSAASVCTGNSTTVGAASTAGHTYSWTSSPSGFTSTVSNPSVSPTATTTYTLLETITATGCTASNTVVITVNPIPGNNAGSATSICAGISTTLGAASTAGHTYSWTSSPSGFTSTVSNPSVSPTTTTTYTLTETITATGCTNANSVVITVNPLPAANVGSNNSVCLGSTITIGAASVSGDTYNWTSSPSGFTSTLSNPSVSPTVTTTYTLTEKVTATGCSKINSINVAVHALPTATMSGSATICKGSSTNLSVTLSGQANWSVSYSNGSASSTVSGISSSPALISVSPTTTSTFTVTNVTDGNGCSNTGTGSPVITVNPAPAANAGSNHSYCASSSSTTTLGASAVGGDTYSWSSSPSGFSSTVSNPTVTPTITTTYTLRETITSTGCTNSNTVVITINPTPSAALTGGGTICSGASIALSANITGQSPWTIDYSNGTNTGVVSNIRTLPANFNVTPTVTGTFTITSVTDGNGCSAVGTGSAYVVVNTSPAAYTVPSQGLCIGSSISLGTTAVSGHTYSWASTPSGFSSTSANPSVSPTITTTYSLTEVNTSTGCTSVGSTVISTHANPTASLLTSNATVCSGTREAISMTLTGNSPWSITYTNGTTTTTATGITNNSPGVFYVTPTTTTTYTLLSVGDGYGCSNTISGSVVFTVNPAPAAYTGPNRNVCSGSSVSLGGSAVSGHTYSWASYPSGFSSTISNPSVSPTTITTYALTETITATGCTKTDSVIIDASSTSAQFVGGTGNICIGESRVLSVLLTGHAPWTVIYSTGSKIDTIKNIISSPDTFSVIPTTTTTYKITKVIDSIGCTSVGIDSEVVTVYPLPAANTGGAQTICNGSGVTLGASPVGSNTYYWTSDPVGFTSTQSDPSVSPTVTTTYTLLEQTPAGCSNTNKVIITVKRPTANLSGSGLSCSGSPYALTVELTGQTPWTIVYSNGTHSSTITGITRIPYHFNVSPTVTTTYSITNVTDNNGCTNTGDSTAVVTVEPLPTVNLGSSTFIYPGGSATLGAAPVSGRTYSWTSHPSGFTSTLADPTVSPVVTTTYYLTVTNTSTGCYSNDSGAGVIVTVDNLPIAYTRKDASQLNPGGTTQVQVLALKGHDVVEGALGQGNTFIIESLPTNATLYYNGVPITSAIDTINNYDSTKLKIDPNSGLLTSSFTYAVVNDSGFQSAQNDTIIMPFNDMNISGTVFDDANGLKDGAVNGTGNGLPSGIQLYAYLVDSLGNVISKAVVNSNGTYTLTNTADGNTKYTVLLSTTSVSVGASAPAVTLPSGWVSVGENYGSNNSAGSGVVNNANSQITVKTGTHVPAGVNFGIDQLPTTITTIAASQPNPGGINRVEVASLKGTDPEDGSLGQRDTFVITSLPTNASLYYNGVLITSPNDTIKNYDSTKLTIHPNSGALTATFKYKALDAALEPSSVADSIVMPFSDLTISGTIYDNGTGGSSSGTAEGTIAGTQLYANLLNSSGNVVATTAVASNGTYSFGTANGVVSGTNYSISLTTTAGTVGSAGPSTTLPSNLANGADAYGINNGAGTGNTSVANGIVAVNVTGTTSVTAVDFGIDQLPTVSNRTAASQVNPGSVGTQVLSLKGSDPEDGTLGQGSTFVIKTLPTNGTLYYNGVAISSINDTIIHYDSTKFTVVPNSGSVTVAFTYTAIDSASKQSATASAIDMPFGGLSVSGTVFDDANGLMDGAVNGTGTGLPSGTQLYAYLETGTGTVFAKATVNSNGTYTFSNAANANSSYTLLISTTSVSVGATAPAVTLPSGWVSVGEAYGANNSAGTGNDAVLNGEVPITTTTLAITGANLGIDRLPTTITTIAASQPNSGGTNRVEVASLKGTDPEDGSLGQRDTFVITSLPTNASLYYNGVLITSPNDTIKNYDSTKLTIHPNSGALTATFKYKALDAALEPSSVADSIVMPFSDLTISGTIYDNGTGGSSSGTAEGTIAGTQLYANLLNSSGNVVATTAVASNGTYSFGTANGVVSGTNYSISLTTTAGTVGSAGPSTTLPSNLANGADAYGINNGAGTGNTSVANGIVAVNVTGTTSVTAVDFGIDQLPTVSNRTAASQVNPGSVGTQVLSLKGSDPEDGTLGQGSTFVIKTLPTNGTLYYKGVAISSTNDTITHYDSTKLRIVPISGNVTVTFTFTAVDAAGKQSLTASTLDMPFGGLSVSGTVFDDANGLMDGAVNGTGNGLPSGTQLYAYLEDTLGNVIAKATVNSNGTYSIINSVNGNTKYTVAISTTNASVGSLSPAITLPAGWVSVGENYGSNNAAGSGVVDNSNSDIAVKTGTLLPTGVNFGIDQLPTTISTTAASQANPGGSSTVQVASLKGTDPEDGSLGQRDTFVITSLPTNGSLYYNGVLITSANDTIRNYDSTKLTVHPDSGGISVVVNYKALDAAGEASLNTGVITMPFGAIADIQVTNTAPPVLYYHGQTITYTVTAKNLGPDDAAGINVKYVLPLGFTYVSSTTSAGSYNSSTGIWSISGIPTSSTESMTITVTPTAIGTYTTIAEKTAETETDPNLLNDTANTTVIVYPSVNLIVTDSITDVYDDPINYGIITLTARNAGPDIATNVKVFDHLPPGYTFVSYKSSVGSYDTATGVWSIGTLNLTTVDTITIKTLVNTTAPGISGKLARITVASTNPFAQTNFTNNFGLAKFNDSLGTLYKLRISHTDSMKVNIKFENISASGPSSYKAYVTDRFSLNGSTGQLFNGSSPSITDSTSVMAFDGTLDYAGTSGHNFGNQVTSRTDTINITSSLNNYSTIGLGLLNLTDSAFDPPAITTVGGNDVSLISTDAKMVTYFDYYFYPVNDPDKLINFTSITSDQYETLAANNVAISRYVTNHPLPVTLLNFSATKENNKVLLNWTTASEINNNHFDIERLYIANNTWDVIGTVVGHGTTNSLNNYSFTDYSPLMGENNYRLKQVDNNGNFTYSPIRQVDFDSSSTASSQTKVWYNRAEDRIYLNISRPTTMNETIQVIDIKGKVVTQGSAVANTNVTQLSVNMMGLAKGTYTVTTTDNTGTVSVKVVKE